MRKQEPIPTFKVVMLGDVAVGKTSLFSRFSQDMFVQSEITTLTACFRQKIVEFTERDSDLSDDGESQRYDGDWELVAKGQLLTDPKYIIAECRDQKLVDEGVDIRQLNDAWGSREPYLINQSLKLSHLENID